MSLVKQSRAADKSLLFSVFLIFFDKVLGEKIVTLPPMKNGLSDSVLKRSSDTTKTHGWPKAKAEKL